MSEKIRAITMPKWGLAMTEGLVAAWHIEEGAEVQSGQEALDIETEKIANSFESPVSGVIRRRLVAEGETVPVGALLAVVADPSVEDAELDGFVQKFNEEFEVTAAAEAAAPPPEPVRVDIGGRELRYLVLGDAAGAPLLFLHGFGGDLNNWLFNQPVLAESHTAYALDLPGHGGSEKALAGADIGAMTDAVVAFMDAMNLESAHLVGHSMGGAVAASLALEHGARAASLTLVCPAGLGAEINMDYIDGFIGAAKRKELKPVLEKLFADPSLVSRDMMNDVLKFKRLDGAQAALAAIAGAAFEGGRQAFVLRDTLGGIGVPAQVIWGREDQILPVAHGEGLPSSINVHILDGAGHMAHMEQANEVNRLIQELVRSAV